MLQGSIVWCLLCPQEFHALPQVTFAVVRSRLFAVVRSCPSVLWRSVSSFAPSVGSWFVRLLAVVRSRPCSGVAGWLVRCERRGGEGVWCGGIPGVVITLRSCTVAEGISGAHLSLKPLFPNTSFPLSRTSACLAAPPPPLS